MILRLALIQCLILQSFTLLSQSLGFPGPGTVHTVSDGGIQFLNSSSNDTTSGATSLATASFSVTSGNLVACVVNYRPAQSLTSVTDSQSNTYTLLSQAASGSNASQVAYAKNVTGSGSLVVTANFSASTALSGIACLEISGVSTTTPLDLDTNASFSDFLLLSSRELFGGMLTTTTADEAVLIACGYDRDLAAGNTIDNSYISIAHSAQFIVDVFGKVVSSTLTNEANTITLVSAATFGTCTGASFK